MINLESALRNVEVILMFGPGTDDGRVLKAVNVLAYDRVDDVRSVVIEDLQVFPPGTHVENLEVLHISKEDTPQVIAVSADEIFSFPVHRCSQVAKTCRSVSKSKFFSRIHFLSYGFTLIALIFFMCCIIDSL